MVTLSREKKAKYNIVSSLISQFVVIFCGLIIPNILITHFGSEVYGATASITQFLSYIMLLEGGIGGVARASLYKPLAENDNKTVSIIINEVQSFFRIVAIVFCFYSICIAVSYKYISGLKSLDYLSSVLLVLVIAFSSLIQYYFGISNAILINADQKVFINNVLTAGTYILNMITVIGLVKINASIITVKLFSSIVFAMRPIILAIYVKNSYSLLKLKTNKQYLTQKWTGLAQHIAFFLHTNTDIVILTLFTDLRTVAVYSIYNMIVSNIRNVIISFTSGMEALFGDMYAKNEKELLNTTFGYYETLVSVVSVICFGSTLALIIPFVTLYTNKVADTNYIQPYFAIAIIIAECLYCLREPYHCITIAANRFKETKLAAYGETAINITLSIVLVYKFGLFGVALATACAMLFRYVYYAIYLSKSIIYRNLFLFIKRFIINVLLLLLNAFVGIVTVSKIEIKSYIAWIFSAIVVFCTITLITLLTYCFCYKDDMKWVIKRIIQKHK